MAYYTADQIRCANEQIAINERLDAEAEHMRGWLRNSEEQDFPIDPYQDQGMYDGD